ncbi:hypothetical protein HK105_205127 [Polyrhizophydium stewartii]|uniref:Amine oxidase domain-containing protein n=1 Tax=Polyrhizophydium stewartii TaxID=2732419 RepID=A0ABR4N6U2_9FUNG|nr:hypothetical protein HK105_006799 [Polyrhizophydium stewartii]
MPPLRVAVVGSGISGLAAAWLLSRGPERFSVTVFEAADYLGGHTHTVDVASLDGSAKVGVDTGFIVCNPVTYPNFLAFLEALGVPLVQSDMSFSVSRNGGEFEWCGDNLDTVFAQRTNLLPFAQPGGGMFRLLWDCIRFHAHAKQIAVEADQMMFDDQGNVKAPGPASDSAGHPLAKMTLGSFFSEHGYSRFFYENYVLPMTAAIWSSPADVTFDKFPLLTLVRFMRNHVMLQIGGRPKWRTVDGGSRNYVARVTESVKDIRLSTRIVRVQRPADPDAAGPVLLTDDKGRTEKFDHVIFATHTDQTLEILGESATPLERKIIGAIKYSKNRAVLHRDATLMPTRTKAWAAWNYLTTSRTESKSQSMCLTYWMNRLQPFVRPEVFGQVFVTMNPLREPKADTVLGAWDYDHPLYTPETIAAQESLNEIQNKHATTFCGAWTNYGFHEDGCTSGLLAAQSLGAACPFPVRLNGGYPTARLAPPPPAHLAAKGVQRYKIPPPIHLSHAQGNGSSAGFGSTAATAASSLGLLRPLVFVSVAVAAAAVVYAAASVSA